MTESTLVNAVPEPALEAQAPSRARRDVPWRDVLGLLASCLVVVVAFSPILFFGHTISAAGNGKAAGTNGWQPFPGQPLPPAPDFRADPGASVWQLEPWGEVAHRAYTDGDFPLWNPYEGAGAPLAANMASAALDPLLFAVYLHPTPLVWDLSIIGAFIFGAAAAYLFGRVLGLRVVAAVVGSAAFSLSGWFFMYSNNHFSRSYVFLPVLFLLVELTLRTRRWWPVFALGVAVAENIYIGMPEASFFVIGPAAVYATARLWQERRTMPVHISLARLGGGSVLGLMLAAPLLLLFLEYEPLSFNIHKPEDNRGSEADPAMGILHLIAPWFPGAPEPPAGPRTWFGAAVAVSALAAVSGRHVTKRLHAWLFLVLGVAVLVKSYDFHVLEWVGRLPVAKLIVFPTFAAPVASFAFAMLAGIGVQVLWDRDLRIRRFLTLLTLALIVLVVVLSKTDRLRVIVEERQTVWGRAALFAVLAIAAVMVASWLGRRWAATVLAGAIIFELFWLAPFTIYGQRADPFLTPGWMPLVRAAQGAEPYSRVLGVDAKLYPDTAGALGLYDIRALDALYVGRYWRYVRTFVLPEAYDRFTGDEGPLPRLHGNPMFDALGVRAVLSEQDLGPVPSLRLLGRDRDTRVYKKIDAYPRAWVVHKVHLVGEEDEAFDFLKARAHRRDDAFIVDSFDPRLEAVVEHDGNTTDDRLRVLQSGPDACTTRRPDRVSIQRYSGDSVSLRVNAGCAGLLVLPDTYFPGWKATVNGRDRTIYPTDGAFRGVTVPEGTSQVEFRYEPRGFSIGVVLAAAGLIAFAVIGLARWWRTQSRHPTVPPSAPRQATVGRNDPS